ncbi:MAG: right-handed parallel beta-helix repeat-containing protein [Planctomycetes bacterium]|nr:right-handed parallel beta-helix repeat-containing protein [Planctomycetota bacterium]
MRQHSRPLLAAFASLLLAPALTAQCGTTVTTPVSNTTWTLAGSPYCVNATVQVSRLTIQPGVEVRLAAGVSLQVSTWLRALGTRTQPIRFQAQNLGAGRWGGIEFIGPVAAGNPSQLLHCIVTQAGNSGIRILDNEQVLLERCWIHDNTSPLDGGGLRIELTAGTVRALDCDIEGNRAGRNGGGVRVATVGGGRVVLTRCRIRGNLANASNVGAVAAEGGGVRASGTLELEGCHVADNALSAFGCNAPPARGGGLSLSDGSHVLRNSLISGNRCWTSGCGGVNEGGGLYAASTVPSLLVANCLLSCNSTTANTSSTTLQGSGISTLAATTRMENCTIARNVPEGVRIGAGSATILNTIVFEHAAGSVVGTAAVSYSDIQGGWIGGTGNVRFNPAFVGSGCQPEHFTLNSSSPCIDAGDPAVASNDACLPPAQGGPRNDMGAHGGPGSCGFAGPALSLCGAQTYGELRQGNDAMTLDWTALSAQAPFTGRLDLAQGAPSSPGLLLLSGNPAELALSGITLLVGASSVGVVPIALDGAGAFRVSFDLQITVLVGVPLFFQGFSLPASGAIRASNGLRLAPCF